MPYSNKWLKKSRSRVYKVVVQYCAVTQNVLGGLICNSLPFLGVGSKCSSWRHPCYQAQSNYSTLSSNTQIPFEDFFVVLIGFAKWLGKGGMHEVLQLFVNVEIDATCQPWLELKHLTLNALHHPYQFSKCCFLFGRIVISRRLFVLTTAAYTHVPKENMLLLIFFMANCKSKE